MNDDTQPTGDDAHAGPDRPTGSGPTPPPLGVPTDAIPPAAAPQWYENVAIVVVSLLCCAPLGIALVWMQNKWSTALKVIITAAIAGVTLVFILIGAAGSTTSGTRASETEPAATKPRTSATTAPGMTTTTNAPTTTTLPPPVLLEGNGDDVVQLSPPLTSGKLVVITYSGSRNFIVQAQNAAGENLELLVNEIGAYTGTKLYVEDSAALLEVQASGPWSIEIKDLAQARQWDGNSPLSGSGDDVVGIPGGLPSLRLYTVANDGARNFVVYSFTRSERNLLINEIGAYSGTKSLPRGTTVLAVESSGSWSFTPK